MKPVVSVICITYNQEGYIRKALDSFLEQKVSFPIEVIVHDDASTDGTAEIIREYTDRYPDIIRSTLETENQYKSGSFQFVNDMFVSAKGKYIAMCEGDDYWSDPLKLQKQVKYLDNHPSHAMCFSLAEVVYEDGSEEGKLSPELKKNREFNLGELLKDNFINTCTVMYRARDDYESLVQSVLPQDLYIHVFHARDGRIGFLKEPMAVYRKQAGGVWWDSGDRMNAIYGKYRFQLTNLFSVLLEMLRNNRTYTKIINRHVDYLFDSFIVIDKTRKTSLFTETTRDFPELVAEYTLRKYELLNEMRTEKERLQGVSDSQAHELQSIKDSKWYRLNPKVIAHRHEHEPDTQ